MLFVGLIFGALFLLPVALILVDGPATGALAWLSAPLALGPTRAVLTRTDGPSLNAALAGTGTLLAAYSVLLSVGLLLG
jgi:1,4-dihydroxy-2-naphthoate octaprenyltransferase